MKNLDRSQARCNPGNEEGESRYGHYRPSDSSRVPPGDEMGEKRSQSEDQNAGHAAREKGP